jgi:hypothetical protein
MNQLYPLFRILIKSWINHQFSWRIDSGRCFARARTLSPIKGPPRRPHKRFSPSTAAAPSTSPLPRHFKAAQALLTRQGEPLKPPSATPSLTLDGSPPEQATVGAKLEEEEELPVSRPSRRFPTTVEP